jgi:arylsulfatase A-like enzyme
VLLVAPMVAVAFALAAFLILWRIRAPLRGSALLGPAAAVGALAALLPWALDAASAKAGSIALRWAALLAAAIFGVPLAVVVRARWIQDFQFLPWPDIAVGGALIVTIVVAAQVLRRLGPRVRMGSRLLPVALVALAGGAVAVVLGAGAYEPARKAATAHAGIVAAFLEGARRVFDFDRDGFPSMLGGGDCKDDDASINPGSFDWPDDGVDQDCDGRDASVAALTPGPLHPVPDAVPRDLNVVFVTIDTLRADHLGCYGHARPTSPELDRLAAQGILFETGWAHAPSTRYSMPALATARWPAVITWQDCAGCDNWWPRLSPSDRTVGEAFHDLGYVTGALYSYGYFKKRDARGFERGIDHYDDRRAALHVNVNGPMESVGSSSREVADDAIAFLTAQRDKKFFLWVHFYDPHLGYERHAEAPVFGQSQADLYDGEIWYTDHHFGRVLAHLRTLGIDGRTAVFVTGDHGEGLGERKIVAHGYDLYGPQTKVPFIARVPGLAPRKVKTPVGHVDIAPTLVNLARGQAPRTFLGRSMVDLMTGTVSGRPPGPVFQEVSFEGPTVRRGIVTETHHLVWRAVPDNTTECFDLVADPGETRDLWATPAGEPVCRRLKEELQAQVSALALHAIADGVTQPGGRAPEPAHKPGPPAAVRLGQAVRFLGYDATATEVPRGGQTEIVMHFESLEPIAGWKMFFHLEGPGGFRNLDHVPVQGAFPLERWRPGQRIRDRQNISFAPTTPPGAYTLYVGIYRRGDERLPVTPSAASDGRDRLRVATIFVH